MVALGTMEGFEPLSEELAQNTRTRNVLAQEYLDIRFSEIARVAKRAEELYGVLAEAREYTNILVSMNILDTIQFFSGPGNTLR